MDSRSENPLLTVVVPVYNEEEALPSFASCLIELCRSRGWMTVFVNDGSSDHTRQLLDHPAPGEVQEADAVRQSGVCMVAAARKLRPVVASHDSDIA